MGIRSNQSYYHDQFKIPVRSKLAEWTNKQTNIGWYLQLHPIPLPPPSNPTPPPLQSHLKSPSKSTLPIGFPQSQSHTSHLYTFYSRNGHWLSSRNFAFWGNSARRSMECETQIQRWGSSNQLASGGALSSFCLSTATQYDLMGPLWSHRSKASLSHRAKVVWLGKRLA